MIICIINMFYIYVLYIYYERNSLCNDTCTHTGRTGHTGHTAHTGHADAGHMTHGHTDARNARAHEA